MKVRINSEISSNLLWRLFERVGAQGVSFVVSIVLARILEPDAFGTVALVMSITAILQVFVDSGLGNALIQKKDADDLDFSTVFWANVIFCIFLYIVLFLCAPAFAYLYGNESLVNIIRVSGIILIISGVKNVQQAYVSRTTVVLWLTVKCRPHFCFSWSRLHALLVYGWKLLAAKLLETVYSESRSFIIGKKYSSSDLAYYNKGRQLPNLIVSNTDVAIASVLFPVLSKEQNNIESFRLIVQKTIKTNTYIIAPIMAGLAACAEPLIRILLTEKWLFCVPYLRVFCFTFAFVSFNTANMNSYRSIGRSDIYLYVEIIRKVVGIIALLIAMWHGVIWIAYSEVIATVASMIISSTPNKKLIGYGFVDQLKDVFGTIMLTLVMFFITYIISLFKMNDFLLLAIQVTVGICVYIIGSLVTNNESFYQALKMVHFSFKRKE